MASDGGICPACGRSNPEGMRFCGHCGAPLPQAKKPTSAVSLPDPLPTTRPASPSARADKAVPPAPIPPALPPRPRPAPPPIPADPIARERDRERLITQANAFRVKGQVTDARETLQKALHLAEGMSPRDRAPLHEQIGDLLQIEEFYDEAIEQFQKAMELDPRRSSAEKKYAEAALEKARSAGKLASGNLRDDSLVDIIASGDIGPAGKRNAGAAMFLSLLVPGAGQFYNRQVHKAIIILGIFLISMLVIGFSPERDDLFQDIIAMLTLQMGKAYRPISPLITGFALLAFGAWLYSLVDAPFNAGKVETYSDTRTGVDKSGWEV